MPRRRPPRWRQPATATAAAATAIATIVASTIILAARPAEAVCTLPNNSSAADVVVTAADAGCVWNGTYEWRSVTVGAGAVVKLTGAVFITASASFTVAAGARIDGVGRGGNATTGTPPGLVCGGGAHAGCGGEGNCGLGAYGAYDAPVAVGSMGTAGNVANEVAPDGGAALRITSLVVSINGTIDVSGQAGEAVASGCGSSGGSGGSIFITANSTLTRCSGTLRAAGGAAGGSNFSTCPACYGCGGSGGRIAVVAAHALFESPDASQWPLVFDAVGGAPLPGAGRRGAPGTVYVSVATSGAPILIVNNTDIAAAAAVPATLLNIPTLLQLSRLVLSGGAALSLQGNPANTILSIADVVGKRSSILSCTDGAAILVLGGVTFIYLTMPSPPSEPTPNTTGTWYLPNRGVATLVPTATIPISIALTATSSLLTPPSVTFTGASVQVGVTAGMADVVLDRVGTLKMSRTAGAAAATLNLSSLTLVNASTMDVGTGGTLLVSGPGGVTVANVSTLTLLAGASMHVTHAVRVRAAATIAVNTTASIYAGNMTVEAGGTVGGYGMGEGECTGLGAGVPGTGVGGSHAGCGGRVVCNPQGAPPTGGMYGSALAPVEPGSGGCKAVNASGGSGGSGGAAIRIVVNDTLTLAGSVVADGGVGGGAKGTGGGGGGGGSGGSIWLSAATLVPSSSGLVSAAGGNGGVSWEPSGDRGGGGSGGRIALTLISCPFPGDPTTWPLRLTAPGGSRTVGGLSMLLCYVPVPPLSAVCVAGW